VFDLSLDWLFDRGCAGVLAHVLEDDLFEALGSLEKK